MASKDSRDKATDDRESEREYNLKQTELLLEFERRQLRFMLFIILLALLLGTALMIAAVGAPLYFMSISSKISPTDMAQFKDMPKDVLPFATGIIGFASGLVTALYGTRRTVVAPS